MPVNGYTIGKDVSLVMQLPSGALTLSGITNFSAQPQTSELKHKGLDGIAQFGVIPDGWSLSFKVDRSTPDWENWWASYETGYFAGVNQPAGTVYQTIQEKDGSLTQWRYTGFVPKLTNAGDYAGDKMVELSISGNASRRIKVS